MWLKFPKGTTAVSVEQQEYSVEHTDAIGNQYTRIPDHLAPRLLDAGVGFVAVNAPADDFPDDLPRADPERDGTIARLLARIDQLQSANQLLVDENVSLRAKYEPGQTETGGGLELDPEPETEEEKTAREAAEAETNKQPEAAVA